MLVLFLLFTIEHGVCGSLGFGRWTDWSGISKYFYLLRYEKIFAKVYSIIGIGSGEEVYNKAQSKINVSNSAQARLGVGFIAQPLRLKAGVSFNFIFKIKYNGEVIFSQ